MKIEVEEKTPSRNQHKLIYPGNVIQGYNAIVLVTSKIYKKNRFSGIILKRLYESSESGDLVSDWIASESTSWKQFTGKITLTYED